MGRSALLSAWPLISLLIILMKWSMRRFIWLTIAKPPPRTYFSLLKDQISQLVASFLMRRIFIMPMLPVGAEWWLAEGRILSKTKPANSQTSLLLFLTE